MREVIFIKDAYLIIANKNETQLQMLIDMLDDSRNDIFLLIDKKSNLINHNFYARYSNLNCLSPINIYWGSYSQVDAELKLLKAAVTTGNYSYYHILSGQDLPLANQDVLHNFFDSHLNHEFIEYQTETKRDINEKLNIHFFRKHFDAGIHSEHSHMNYGCKLFFSIYRHIETVLVRSIKESRIPQDKISSASTWMSIDNELAHIIVNSSKWIYSKFHKGKIVDEIFIPTLINYYPNIFKKVYDTKKYFYSPGKPLSNLMYVKKSIKSAHPKIWRINNLNELRNAKNNGYLFARKFDVSIDDNIIDTIFNDVMNS